MLTVGPVHEVLLNSSLHDNARSLFACIHCLTWPVGVHLMLLFDPASCCLTDICFPPVPETLSVSLTYAPGPSPFHAYAHPVVVATLVCTQAIPYTPSRFTSLSSYISSSSLGRLQSSTRRLLRTFVRSPRLA